MNPLGLLFSFLLIGFWGFGVVVGVIDHQDNSWEFLWRRTILGIILFFLPIIAMFLGYRKERNSELKIVADMIRAISQNKSSVSSQTNLSTHSK